MSIVPTWPIAVGTLVVGLAGGFYAEHTRLGAKIDSINAQHAEQERARQVQRATDERTARRKEQEAALAAGVKAQEQADENARIIAQRDDAVKRLQQRPDRKPASAGGVPAATPACAGTTGAELSRPDAEFLVGEAARADRLRAALNACYGVYEAAGRSRSPEQ